MKKKRSWKNYILPVILFLIGVICGFWVMENVDFSFLSELSPRMKFLGYILFIAIIWISYFLQIIVHEVGHLIFGLLSGYRFSSFRVGKWMLLKKGGKLSFKQFSLAGTGGQCLMIPPETYEKKPPVAWLLLGGAIFNFINGVAFLLLAFFVDCSIWLSLFFGMSAFFAFLYALTNGIPMKTNLVSNDGATVLALCRDADAASDFCRHLTINAQNTEGVRLSEMPCEWFAFPAEEKLQNNAFAETAVFACNRLMDEKRVEDAAERIRYLLGADTALAGVHRKLLICDLIYCELIGERRVDILGELYTREQYNFMRSMQNFPSVIRTEYAYAKLYQHDSGKATKLKDEFARISKTYPNEGDLACERELMKLVDEIVRSREDFD